MKYNLTKEEENVHLRNPGQNFFLNGEVWLVLQGGSKTRACRLSDGKVKMFDYNTKVVPLKQTSPAAFIIDYSSIKA